jgi:hypothetical protein
MLLVPSAGLAAFAALLVAFGVAVVLDEGWIGLVGTLVAGLALYPAWLLARAALRMQPTLWTDPGAGFRCSMPLR